MERSNDMAKRNELKEAKVYVEIGGKRVRKSVYYHTLDEYAEKKKKLLEAAQRANRPTFREIAEQWQEEHDDSVRIYTANCYKRPVLDAIERFGDLQLDEITAPMIQRFLDEMHRQKYAKQTINLRKIVICQIFNYALFHGWTETNPAAVCKVPKTAAKTERELPEDKDIAAIRTHSDGFFGLYLNILLFTGLRREEALALNYEDIDFDRGEIAINKTLIFDGNKGVIQRGTKTTAGKRTVPLLDPLRDLLDENGAGPLFYADGEPITRSRFNKGLAKYKAEHEITATSHQLRHYFCTICFEADLDEKDLANIMGHSKVSLSKDIYTHIRQQRKTESASKLNALFKGDNSA